MFFHWNGKKAVWLVCWEHISVSYRVYIFSLNGMGQVLSQFRISIKSWIYVNLRLSYGNVSEDTRIEIDFSTFLSLKIYFLEINFSTGIVWIISSWKLSHNVSVDSMFKSLFCPFQIEDLFCWDLSFESDCFSCFVPKNLLEQKKKFLL